MESEGGVMDPGPVVQDCLQICCNVLNDSETCQRLTFPKGKISLCDNSIDHCCYREFYEETRCILPKYITDIKTQQKKRQINDLNYIPLDILSVLHIFILARLCV